MLKNVQGKALKLIGVSISMNVEYNVQVVKNTKFARILVLEPAMMLLQERIADHTVLKVAIVQKVKVLLYV